MNVFKKETWWVSLSRFVSVDWELNLRATKTIPWLPLQIDLGDLVTVFLEELVQWHRPFRIWILWQTQTSKPSQFSSSYVAHANIRTTTFLEYYVTNANVQTTTLLHEGWEHLAACVAETRIFHSENTQIPWGPWLKKQSQVCLLVQLSLLDKYRVFRRSIFEVPILLPLSFIQPSILRQAFMTQNDDVVMTNMPLSLTFCVIFSKVNLSPIAFILYCQQMLFVFFCVQVGGPNKC